MQPSCYKWIPNALTMLRLLMVPLFWALFWKGMALRWVAGLVFVLAAFTDWLDGTLARRWQVISDFGKLMDPLADKLMVLSALLCFVIEGTVPWWVLGIVAVREALMVLGAYAMLRRHVVVYARVLGKAAAGLFYLALVLTFVPGIWPYNLWILTAAVVLMLGAFVGYARDFLKLLGKVARRKKKPQDSPLTNSVDRVQ